MTFNMYFTFIIAVFLSLIGLTTVGHTKDCVASVDKTVLFSNDEISQIGERVVDFIAVISSRDVLNSKGKQLLNFGAIIQQDRANYHKSNRADIIDDIKDQDEQYFTTLERRQTLSNAPYYYDCFMSNQDIVTLHNDVLSGKLVTIWIVLFKQPNGSLAVYSTPVG